jgi:hypothetical protein
VRRLLVGLFALSADSGRAELATILDVFVGRHPVDVCEVCLQNVMR